MRGREQTAFADIVIREGPEPRVRYLSGDLVYEEHLLDGCYRTRYWSASAAIKPDGELEPGKRQAEVSPLDEAAVCAFRLSADGQELWDRWQWAGARREAGPAPGILRAVVELVHAQRPIAVQLHTALDGTPFVVRWLEITNRGHQPAAVGRVSPLSGTLFAARRLRENLPAGTKSSFTLGRFASHEARRECDFRWLPLPAGSYAYGGDRYGPPFFVVRNEVTHDLFIGHLAWSGAFELSFYHDHAPGQAEAWLCD